MDGKLLKICRTELCDMKGDNTPGKVISVANDCFYVSCGNSTVLKVLTIQAEGKKVMDVKDYLRGNTIEQDVILGGQ